MFEVNKKKFIRQFLNMFNQKHIQEKITGNIDVNIVFGYLTFNCF